MLMNRRSFLQNIAVFSAIGMAPKFLVQAAGADPLQAIQGFKDDRVLVVVQFGGGNDGLNMVVPHSNDTYHRLRPTIGIDSKDVLRINDDIGLNPEMTGLMRLYDRGMLGIVQGVGYPNPDRSHFRSMEIWQTASGSDEYISEGWIGRYFDNTCSGCPNPEVGVAIGTERPQAFEGKTGLGIATEDPKRFGWKPGDGVDTLEHFQAINAEGASGNGTLDFLRHTTTNALLSSKDVRRAAEKGDVEQARGGKRNASQLQTVAGLIRGGLSTRIYYVSVGGFDTHVNQKNTHSRLLGQCADALAEFQAQLEQDGTAERVVTMVFSEFGRRVHENGGGGTDHGTAAPMFVLGKGIKPGLHGAAPNLDDLQDGDLKYTTDFRGVYASLLEQWFQTDPAAILGKKFSTQPLIV